MKNKHTYIKGFTLTTSLIFLDQGDTTMNTNVSIRTKTDVKK